MILLLLFSIAAATVNSVLLHKVSGKIDTVSFNMYGALTWVMILTVLNGFSVELTSRNVWWGILYGTVQMLFMLFKTKAMGAGPVSVTTLIGNCSLLLSTTVGIVLWKESVSVAQIAGIMLLIVAFFCCTCVKAGDGYSCGWVVYSCLFFVFCASVGIIFKAFSKSGSSGTNDMMLVASVTMLIWYGAVKGYRTMVSGAKENSNSKSILADRRLLALTIGSGILSCVYNRLNISLAGLFPATIFYPCFNGGVIVLSLALGTYVLGEKLSLRQMAGIVLGTAAVLIIGLCG